MWFVAGLCGACTLVGCSGGLDQGPVSLEPGQSTKRLISTHCGYDTLTVDINGQTWSTNDIPLNEIGARIEPRWPSDQNIVFELELVNERTLLVRPVDSDIGHIYRPDLPPDGCL